jgi:N-acetylmuramoyl-L-alanine amidase
VSDLQRRLADYGYGLEITGRYDTATAEVVAAFQRHFRPAKIDGIADSSTLHTLQKLLAARDQPAPPKDDKPPHRPEAETGHAGPFGHPLTRET